MSYDIRELYKSLGMDIEPSWHLVFLKLKEAGKCTMSDLAEAFQLSLPAMTKMITRMKRKGYVKLSQDRRDLRRKIVQLSNKAEKLLPEFEKVWEAGQAPIHIALRDNPEFLIALERFEATMKEKSFRVRVLGQLNLDTVRAK
jgi:MarR family transcriptional repressor of emrRAB